MTSLQEALDVAITRARAVKEDLLRDPVDGDPDTDLDNLLLIYRGAELVALVFPRPSHDGDALLSCAGAAAAGFDADTLALVCETWQPLVPLNPATGRKWGPGEMQQAADRGGVAQGVVQGAVMVSIFNRAGDHLTSLLPYRLGHRKVIWDEARTVTAGQLSSPAQKQITEFMMAPSIAQLIGRVGVTATDFGLDEEEGRAHADCAVSKILLGINPVARGFPRASVALAAEPHSKRWRVISESMPPQGLLNYIEPA